LVFGVKRSAFGVLPLSKLLNNSMLKSSWPQKEINRETHRLKLDFKRLKEASRACAGRDKENDIA
jgi:hypothetical protein